MCHSDVCRLQIIFFKEYNSQYSQSQYSLIKFRIATLNCSFEQSWLFSGWCLTETAEWDKRREGGGCHFVWSIIAWICFYLMKQLRHTNIIFNKERISFYPHWNSRDLELTLLSISDCDWCEHFPWCALIGQSENRFLGKVGKDEKPGMAIRRTLAKSLIPG